jgi:hypothetical protein
MKRERQQNQSKQERDLRMKIQRIHRQIQYRCLSWTMQEPQLWKKLHLQKQKKEVQRFLQIHRKRFHPHYRYQMLMSMCYYWTPEHQHRYSPKKPACQTKTWVLKVHSLTQKQKALLMMPKTTKSRN